MLTRQDENIQYHKHFISAIFNVNSINVAQKFRRHDRFLMHTLCECTRLQWNDTCETLFVQMKQLSMLVQTLMMHFKRILWYNQHK